MGRPRGRWLLFRLYICVIVVSGILFRLEHAEMLFESRERSGLPSDVMRAPGSRPVAHERTPERRVISFSLFGSDDRYVQGALQNLALLNVHFPGWTVYFYVDDSVPLSIIQQLQTPSSEIKWVDDFFKDVPGAYWRFLVADDPTVDRYIMRDVDSRLTARDRLAVDEWVQSRQPFHIMRDHPAHCGWPINAGMWGGVKGQLGRMRRLLERWMEQDGKESRYDQDQRFLRDMIWPNISRHHLAHDSHCCLLFPRCHPFPTRRSGFEHVGQVFLGNGMARQGDIDALVGARAPEVCRLRADWEYG